MEHFAERYWGSLAPAAMPGLSETEFDADSGETTTAGLHGLTVTRKRRFAPSVRAYSAPPMRFSAVIRNVDISTMRTRKVPRQPQWGEVFARIMRDESGEGITMQMRMDAIHFLSKIPAGISMPVVELGTEEVTFEWCEGDKIATASVEGDGLIGYALKRGERFVPGEGPEDLSADEFPSDLLEYLSGLMND